MRPAQRPKSADFVRLTAGATKSLNRPLLNDAHTQAVKRKHYEASKLRFRPFRRCSVAW